MKNLDRRQWLKSAGLTGSLALFGGFGSLEAANVLELPSAKQNASPIRLSSNENPYGPSKIVREAMIKAFDHTCRYPYGYMTELVKAIAAKEGVPTNHVVLTGGSTEGLKAAGLAYAIGGGEVT